MVEAELVEDEASATASTNRRIRRLVISVLQRREAWQVIDG
ncbi:MAG: hypothetical protein QM756_41905 [Polyangiaceae bacterium]